MPHWGELQQPKCMRDPDGRDNPIEVSGADSYIYLCGSWDQYLLILTAWALGHLALVVRGSTHAVRNDDRAAYMQSERMCCCLSKYWKCTLTSY